MTWLWFFRAIALGFFVWLSIDHRTYRVDWLLLVTLVCFFILGSWTRERAKQRRKP